MKIRWVQFAVMAFAFTACTWAQDASGDRSCTDLSGKVRLPCPHEKQQDPAAKPVGQETIERGQPESQPPTLSAGASAGHVPSSTNSVDDGTPAPPATRVTQNGQPYGSLERSFARNFVVDQKGFWTSPLKLRVEDSRWLLPLAGAMSVVVLSDTDIESHLPTDTSFIKNSKSFSDYGAAAYAGMVGSAYLWSRATHNDHLRETAVLSGEAALNSLLVTEAAKYIAGRSRPLEGDGTGSFRNGGSSFPSMHSAGAWAIASVVAREYPGPLTQLLAYGGAAAISAARVTGRQHFVSDALVGSAIGWYLGRQVFNARRDRENPDAAYGTFQRTSGDRGPRDPAYMGSPFVPLDSWIYPAMDRLAALGYVPTAFAGLRPWTRMECARLLEEVGAAFPPDYAESGIDREAHRLHDALQAEFSVEARRRNGGRNVSFDVESVYVRVAGISGKTLDDSYHFGQTIINDYGRPYAEGTNLIGGFSVRAQAGPLAAYVRAEYQHAPATPGFAQGVREAFAAEDGTPVPSAGVTSGVDRIRLVEAYVALNVAGNQISFGKQSMWWGPSRGGPFLFSNNAESIPMLRLTREQPIKLPSFFSILGSMRTEFFLGQLDGQRFIRLPDTNTIIAPARFDPQPYVHGEKISFRPTENFEFSVSRTTIFAGYSRPLTARTFYQSMLSFANKLAFDPGDRRSAVDFSYRVPGLRKWLVLYDDSFTEDEYSPIGYPRRSSHQIGLHMPQVPGVPKLELRAEGVFTDMPGEVSSGDAYWNTEYRSGYTNLGQVLGNWVGREGRGMQFWGTYWFSPRNTIEVSYRKQAVNPEFLKGGILHDVGGTATWMLQEHLGLQTSFQYQRWNFPLLSSQRQSNIVAKFQLTYWPRWSLSKHN